MSKPRNNAIVCYDISKEFPIYDGKSRWRFLKNKQVNTKVTHALQHVSFEVPQGKFVGILGHNGAGKSTLLRTLGGVYEPSSGYVKINGQLSSLFELGGFGNRFITGREYAKRLLRLWGVKKKHFTKYLDDILDFSELAESFDAPIYTYSSGMAARLYFSTATALQHDVYLIDEVLSVGDQHFQDKCWYRLRERFNQGVSGVLVTHDWSAVIKLCEVAYILDRGKVIATGRADITVQQYLNLPLPQSKSARFCANIPSSYQVHSQEMVHIPIKIQVAEAMPIALSFSIELLRLGLGWEILMLHHCGVLTEQVGEHDVILTIPKLPLAAGSYSLNLFLETPAKEGQEKISHDVKSWTFGNGIELLVVGQANEAAFNLAFEWVEV